MAQEQKQNPDLEKMLKDIPSNRSDSGGASSKNLDGTSKGQSNGRKQLSPGEKVWLGLLIAGGIIGTTIGISSAYNNQKNSVSDNTRPAVVEQVASTEAYEPLPPTAEPTPTRELSGKIYYLTTGESYAHHPYLFSLDLETSNIRKVMDSYVVSSSDNLPFFFLNQDEIIFIKPYNSLNLFNLKTGREEELAPSGDRVDISPNGEKLVYSGYCEEDIIYLNDPNKEELILINTWGGESLTTLTKWLDDELLILYIANYGKGKLYLEKEEEDFNPVLLDMDVEYFFITPDKKIITKRYREEKGYIIDPFTQEREEINVDFNMVDSFWRGSLFWSPDGEYMVFEGENHGQAGLYVVDKDLDKVTTLAIGNVGGYSWAQEDNIVIFSKYNNMNKSYDIFIINRDGSRLEQITDTPEINESWPIWRQ